MAARKNTKAQQTSTEAGMTTRTKMSMALPRAGWKAPLNRQ